MRAVADGPARGVAKSGAADGAGERASEWLGRHSGASAGFILAALMLVMLGRAADTRFTYDEYVTYKIAALPGVGDVWRFFADGLDTTGPLSALIAHATGQRVLCAELAMRLPFLLISLGFGLGLYGVLRRRYPAGFALAALLIPLEMPKVTELVVEARAYAIVFGCTGMAMWLWQSAAEGRGAEGYAATNAAPAGGARRRWSVAGLWLTLAVAMNAHFYAILLVLPFALAQQGHERQQGRADGWVWLALLTSPLGWLPVAGGELASRQYYSQHFYKPTVDTVGIVYESWLMESWPLLLVFMVFVVGVGLYQFQSKTGKALAQGSESGLTRAEWALAFGLMLLPVYGWLASLVVGAYQCRYVMESSAGFILCLVAGAAELCRRNRRAGMIFFALVAVLFLCNENGGYGVDGMAALLHPSRPHVEMESAVRQQAWVKRLSASALPVAVDNESYRTLDLYASPELRGRSWGLTDMAGAEKHEGAMTDQINLVQFSKRFPMQNMEVGAFMEANPDFLMVVQREARHFEWLPQYLLARRGTAAKLTISLLELDNRNGMAVYEVRSGATAGDQTPAIASTVERP